MTQFDGLLIPYIVAILSITVYHITKLYLNHNERVRELNNERLALQNGYEVNPEGYFKEVTTTTIKEPKEENEAN